MRSELRPWLRVLAPWRTRLIAGALLMLATFAASIGLLALSGWFITATGVTALLWAAGQPARLEIYVPGGGIRFFALARTAARYFERVVNHDTVLRLLADVRTRLFGRLVALDPARLARFRSADLLNRVTADVDALDNLYLRALAPPAVALLTLLALAGLCAAFAPSLVLPVLIVPGGALAVITLYALRGGNAPGHRLTGQTESLRARVIEAANGMAELRAFGAWDRHRQQLARIDAARLRNQERIATRTAFGEQMLSATIQLTAVLVLWQGAQLYQAGEISGPVLALLPLAVLAAGEALQPVPRALIELGHTSAAAGRLNGLVETPPAIGDPDSPAEPPAASDLCIESLRFRHNPADAPLFDGFGLHVGAGEVAAVLGPSGCGKSTLADLCCRLQVPEAGTIHLGGTDIARLRQTDLHARIGYLTQRTELLDDTILANLRLGRPDAGPKAVWQALEVAGLADFVDSLPEGVGTWIGEHGVRLSGGQARRLALARVLLRDAPVVLLDEPLAGLDAATAAEVAGRLHNWFSGRVVLLFAHEADALPPANRYCRLGARESA